MDALTILTVFTALMLVGILITVISNRLKISNVLFLILAGLILGGLNEVYGYFQINPTALVTLAIIALVMIVFDGTSKFKAKAVEDISFHAIRIHIWFIVFNVLLISFLFNLLFLEGISVLNMIYGVVFAIMLAATDPASIFAMLKNGSNKIIQHLEVEAIINTPFTILIPLVVVDLMGSLNVTGIELIGRYLNQILTQILVGIGTGVVIGILFFRGMRQYSEKISPVALLSSALFSYILAEQLNGSGVLAVAVLGFIFGKMFVSRKELLQSFSAMISSTLEILVFILLGFIINIELSLGFIIKSIVIMIVLAMSRYYALKMSMKELQKNEIIFMTLNMPKGIATAVLLFSLSVLNIPELDIIINLTVMIIIYSLILSTIANRFSKEILGYDIEEAVDEED